MSNFLAQCSLDHCGLHFFRAQRHFSDCAGLAALFWSLHGPQKHPEVTSCETGNFVHKLEIISKLHLTEANRLRCQPSATEERYIGLPSASGTVPIWIS